MDEDARLKKLDYTAPKTLQFVAGLQGPLVREVCLRMRRPDTYTKMRRSQKKTSLLNLDIGAVVTLVTRRAWRKLGSPALELKIMPVKKAEGSPMKTDGKFSTDFSVRDRITGKNIQGNGTCYVIGMNLLELEWCIQLPLYKELKDKYRCRMVTKEEANRAKIIAGLKKQYADVF
ncbi:hypothetical protein RB195_021881 [Necator americanus]|uniref:Uncharacterized protein n=1 Tax=Necator americanus TaxID=51031 RepID=A0ABR1EDA2_NECAM